MKQLEAWVTMYCFFAEEGWRCAWCGAVGAKEALCRPVPIKG